MNETEMKIRESIKGLSKEEAIEDLEERIFIEKMADSWDRDFIYTCYKIIEELRS